MNSKFKLEERKQLLELDKFMGKVRKSEPFVNRVRSVKAWVSAGESYGFIVSFLHNFR